MCNECGFYWDDHWFDVHMVRICPVPIENFLVTEPPEEEEEWTEEDEMLFNTFSKFMK